MRFAQRAVVLVAFTTLTAGISSWLPQAAHADAATLSITSPGDVTGNGSGITVTLSGTTPSAAYLWAYVHGPSNGPCLATPHDELLANETPLNTGGGSNNGIYTLAAGAFSEQATLGLPAGNNIICGYLEIPSSNPSDPGPMYTTPAAFDSHTILSQPCSLLDQSFSLTQFAAQTDWDDLTGKTNGAAQLTATSNTPGTIVATGPDNETDSGDSPITVGLSQYPVAAGQVSKYQLVFYPGMNGSCAMADGTVVATGPGSSFHAPAGTLAITWFAAGAGASATWNGSLLPGSNPPPTPVDHTPTIKGTGKVGTTNLCSVAAAVPPGDVWNYGWFANGNYVGSGQTLVIPASLYGKSLTCAVENNGLDGWPTATSAPVTVGLGTLSVVKAPTLMNAPHAGSPVAVNFGKWGPRNVPLKYAYQWYLGSAPIKGATKSNYLIPAADKGKKLSVKVTVTSRGFTPASVTTKPTKIK